MPVSGPYILQTGTGAGSYDLDADLKLSPLWPLQQALRSGFNAAINNDQTTPQQTARVTTPRNEVEALFAQWRNYTSLTKLRAAIEAALDPQNLDLADDQLLAGYQAQLLALSQWNDSLPS